MRRIIYGFVSFVWGLHGNSIYWPRVKTEHIRKQIFTFLYDLLSRHVNKNVYKYNHNLQITFSRGVFKAYSWPIADNNQHIAGCLFPVFCSIYVRKIHWCSYLFCTTVKTMKWNVFKCYMLNDNMLFTMRKSHAPNQIHKMVT